MATDEASITNFLAENKDTTAVLYYFDKTQSQSAGFWSGLANLFSADADDNEYEKQIAASSNMLKIDVSEPGLTDVKNSRGVPDLPYVQVYKKNEKKLAEKPDGETMSEILKVLEVTEE